MPREYRRNVSRSCIRGVICTGALCVVKSVLWSKNQETGRNGAFPAQKYSDYVRDKAVIGTLSAVILGALAEVIGDDELEKLF